jgi:alpha-L-fucosidase
MATIIRAAVAATGILIITSLAGAADPPAPYGALPGTGQLAWHELEFYGFVHFTINTFTDKEWGYGDESPALFNPTGFSAEQIVGTMADAGMAGVILTCKHHDGFCLWPSKFTRHSVAGSPWMDGKGDVVRAFADACRARGLRFGIYLSPWDRNHPEYGRPAYVEYYRNQLRELLTQYGPVFEVWFDGANGGDGYYGGARERRTIDPTTYYDWPNTWKIVRELAPNACMFSDVGPDIRWVGNESGYAGDPCWATYTPRGRNGKPAVPGQTMYEEGQNGHRGGKYWLPAEVDVSIRPGWFWHERENDKVRTPENLVQLYYQSVGRGASLLLNLPPDRRGRLHDNDVASLLGMRRILGATFGRDLAKGAKATASNSRGGGERRFAPANVLDGSRATYWSTDDSVTSAVLELELGGETTFNVVSLREFLPLGQRVETWALDRWDGKAWTEFGAGTAIGSRRLWRGELQTAAKVRLRVTGPVCPAISEFALHREPVI